jgi:hypothetical protein
VSIPESLEISLREIACDVKDGLLSLSVAVGMRVLKVMMESEVEQIAGPRGKHHPCRRAFRHGTAEQGSVIRRPPGGCVLKPTYCCACWLITWNGT